MKNILDNQVVEVFLQRMQQLSEESAAKWGKMTVNEMLAHLNDAFKIALGMKDTKDNSSFFSRHIMFPVAVYLLSVWPKETPTAPELDQKIAGTTARDFYTEYGFLCKMITIFQEREDSKIKPHPMFGKLSKNQWADLLTRHIDHHLNQFGV